MWWRGARPEAAGRQRERRRFVPRPSVCGLLAVDILHILPQQLVFGLALGTVYGLIALGYTMVYGILFMINFAHGEIFMIGAYIGWGVLAFLLNAQITGLHAAWVVPLMLLQAMLG